MPVDKTRPSKPNSALRRSRGEIACAECRRLKLKCDKRIPCSSCVRRGCTTICPHGTLAGGHGTRFILSDTEDLHRKLIAMSERIRQLEDALRIACPNGHSLLAEDLLTVKHGIDASVSSPPAHANVPSTSTEADAAIDALNESLGTLVIGEGGSTVYIGTTGVAANVLIGEDSSRTELPTPSLTLVDHLSETWPFYPIPDNFDRSELLSELLAYLPTKMRLSSLCEALFEYLIWTPRTVSRSQVIEEVIPAVYGRPGDETSPNLVDFHDIALLFMVCALGSIADLTEAPRSEEASKYYTLARAALSLKSVFTEATLTTIQVLNLMNEYVHFLRIPKQEEVAWMIYSMMEALAISMGLHRDPSRWNLDPALSERRRTIFWQIFWTDSWKSLATGRPPFFSIADIDCAFPEPLTAASGVEDAETFRLWFFKYGKEVIHPIAKRLMSAEPLKHSEVLEFDRQVREYPYFRSSIQVSAQDSPSRLFWASAPKGARENALLYIHRPFFAKAMLRSSENPLHGPYASSVLCAYTSALASLKHIRELFGMAPLVSARCWFLWPHAVCSLIVVSSVVALKPNLDIVPSGMVELSLSVEMFEQAVRLSDGLRTHLPLVLRLRSKAFEAYAEHRSNPEAGARAVSPPGPDFSRELALLGGQTRSVYVNESSTTPKPSSRHTPPQGAQQAPSTIRRSPPAFDYPATSGLTSMIMSPSMFTSQPNIPASTSTYTDASGIPGITMQQAGFGNMPLSYPIPNLQALDNERTLNVPAGGSIDIDKSGLAIPQDTWNDLLSQTGVYRQEQDGDGSSDIEWSLPESFQDWI